MFCMGVWLTCDILTVLLFGIRTSRGVPHAEDDN
jgi:hypothetical protein